MCLTRRLSFLLAKPLFTYLSNGGHLNWPIQSPRWLSLTPEFKTRFHFPLERLDQILDGNYSKKLSWTSKWKAYLEQFHKLRIDQIKDMLSVCAKRRAMPKDLLTKLQTVHWTFKLSEGTGADLASVLHSLAILTSSKQLRKGSHRSEKFVENVLKQALQRKDLTEFQSIALSQSLYAFALLELENHPLIEVYSSEMVKSGRLRRFSTQSLSNILWSWTRLNHFNLARVESISNAFIDRMSEANEQQLANVIWSWGVMEYRNRRHWAKIVHELKSRQERLTGQGLATMLVACGRIGFRDDQSFAELIKYIVQTNKVVLFNSQVLSNLVWALGKVQYPLNDPHLLSIIHQATKASRLEDYNQQELCCLATGLQGLNFQEIESVKSLQEEIIKENRLNQFNGQELSTLVLSFSKLPVNSDDFQKHLASEITRRVSSFDEFLSKHLVTIVLGWAHCQFSNKVDSNLVFREVMKSSRLRNYTPQELSNLTWAFGKLKIHSNNLYAKLSERICLEENLKMFSPQSLSNILIGWANGRFHNSQAIEAIGGQILKDKNLLEKMKDQEIANVCWALGKLKVQDQRLIGAVAIEAVKKTRLRSYTPQHLSNILLGWSKSDMKNFNLWDQVIREFTKRDETLVMDVPVFHNMTMAMKNKGFNGLNDYRNRREKGTF